MTDSTISDERLIALRGYAGPTGKLRHRILGDDDLADIDAAFAELQSLRARSGKDRVRDEELIVRAYLRGIEWGRANGPSPDGVCKVAHDYADKTLSALEPTPSEPVTIDHDDWSFQQRVGGWMLQCFTPEITADKLERNDRFIEEALELVQSLDYSAERAHALVEYVFGREKGEPSQEVGGVMVTLAALCNPNGLNMEMSAETELARILDPAIVLKIRAKQATKPVGSALPIPSEPTERDGDWQIEAFDATLSIARDRNMDGLGGATDLAHLEDMRACVTPEFSRGKLGRWLGWAQCAVVACGAASLDEMKEINRKASDHAALIAASKARGG
jgi:hypothetical protein